MVTVCCITYNHSSFIERCLRSLLDQKTNFEVDFIIHDDASTDNTQKVIKEVVSDDPRVKLILRQTNIKSTGQAIFPILFRQATGKYLAMCEGDDYWSDPLKLQKQFDFLEHHENVVMYGHNVRIIGEEFGRVIDRPFHVDQANGFITLSQLVKGFRFPTNSLFFQNGVIDFHNLPDWHRKIRSGDKFLYLMLANQGQVYYDNNEMGIYRKHAKGIVGSYDTWSLDKHLSIHKNQIFFWTKFKVLLPVKLRQTINENISKEYAGMVQRLMSSGIRGVSLWPFIFQSLRYNREVGSSILKKIADLEKQRCQRQITGVVLKLRILGSKIKQKFKQ